MSSIGASRFSWAVKSAWGSDASAAAPSAQQPPAHATRRELRTDMLHHGIPVTKAASAHNARMAVPISGVRGRTASATSARRPLKPAQHVDASRAAANDALVGIEREYLRKLLVSAAAGKRHPPPPPQQQHHHQHGDGAYSHHQYHSNIVHHSLVAQHGGEITAADLEHALRRIQAEEADAQRQDTLVALRHAADELLASPERSRLKAVAAHIHPSHAGQPPHGDFDGFPDSAPQHGSRYDRQHTAASPNASRYGGHYDGAQGGAPVLRSTSSTPMDHFRMQQQQQQQQQRARRAVEPPRGVDATFLSADETDAVMGLAPAQHQQQPPSRRRTPVTDGGPALSHFGGGSRRPSTEGTQHAGRGALYDDAADADAVDDGDAPLPSSSPAIPMPELAARARRLWDELDTPADERALVEAELLAADTPWNRHELNVHFLRLAKEKEVLRIACDAISRRERTIAAVAEVSQRYARFTGYISAAASHASVNGALPLTESQAGLSRKNVKNHASLSAIHKDMVHALNVYRDATLDALEAVFAWIAVTKRRDFRWRGQLFLTTVLHDLHRAAFRGQPATYLLRLDARYNPLAMTTDPHTVVPARALAAMDARTHDADARRRGSAAPTMTTTTRGGGGRVQVPGLGTLTLRDPNNSGGGPTDGLQLVSRDVAASSGRCEHNIRRLKQWIGEGPIARLQAHCRRAGMRRRYLFTLRQACRFAPIARAFVLRRNLGAERKRLAANRLARVGSGAAVRAHLRRVHWGAITAQRIVRGFLTRCHMWFRNDAALKIQRAFRRIAGRSSGRRARFQQRVSTLQCAGRGSLARLAIGRFAAKRQHGNQRLLRDIGMEEHAERQEAVAALLMAAHRDVQGLLLDHATAALFDDATAALHGAEELQRRAVARAESDALTSLVITSTQSEAHATELSAIQAHTIEAEDCLRWLAEAHEVFHRWTAFGVVEPQRKLLLQEAAARDALAEESQCVLSDAVARGSLEVAAAFITRTEADARYSVTIDEVVAAEALRREALVAAASSTRTEHTGVPQIRAIEERGRRDILRETAAWFHGARRSFDAGTQGVGMRASLEAEEDVLRQGLEATFLADLDELRMHVVALRKQRTLYLYDRFLSAALGQVRLRRLVRRLRGGGTQAKCERRWWRPGSPPLRDEPAASAAAEADATIADDAAAFVTPAEVSPVVTALEGDEAASVIEEPASGDRVVAQSNPIAMVAALPEEPCVVAHSPVPETVSPPPEAVTAHQPASGASSYADVFASQPAFVQRSMLLPVHRVQRLGRGFLVRTDPCLRLRLRETVRRDDLACAFAASLVSVTEAFWREAAAGYMAAFYAEQSALHRVAIGLARRAAAKRIASQLKQAAVQLVIAPFFRNAVSQRSTLAKAAADCRTLAQQTSIDAEARQRATCVADEEAGRDVLMAAAGTELRRARAGALLQRAGRRYRFVRDVVDATRCAVVREETTARESMRLLMSHDAIGRQGLTPDPRIGARCWWTQAHLLSTSLTARARRETAGEHRRRLLNKAGVEPTEGANRVLCLAACMVRSQAKRSIVRKTATLMIQCAWRAHRARQRAAALRKSVASKTVARVVSAYLMRIRVRRLREQQKAALDLRRLDEAARTIAVSWRRAFTKRHAKAAWHEGMSVKEAAARHIQQMMRTALAIRVIRRRAVQQRERMLRRRQEEAVIVIQRKFIANVRFGRRRKLTCGRHAAEGQRLAAGEAQRARAANVIGLFALRFLTRLRAAAATRRYARTVLFNDASACIARRWRQMAHRRAGERRGLAVCDAAAMPLRVHQRRAVAAVSIQKAWRRSRTRRLFQGLIAADRARHEQRRLNEAAASIARCWRRRKQLVREAAVQKAKDQELIFEASVRRAASRSQSTSQATTPRRRIVSPAPSPAMAPASAADAPMLFVATPPPFVEGVGTAGVDDADLLLHEGYPDAQESEDDTAPPPAGNVTATASPRQYTVEFQPGVTSLPHPVRPRQPSPPTQPAAASRPTGRTTAAERGNQPPACSDDTDLLFFDGGGGAPHATAAVAEDGASADFLAGVFGGGPLLEPGSAAQTPPPSRPIATAQRSESPPAALHRAPAHMPGSPPSHLPAAASETEIITAIHGPRLRRSSLGRGGSAVPNDGIPRLRSPPHPGIGGEDDGSALFFPPPTKPEEEEAQPPQQHPRNNRPTAAPGAMLSRKENADLSAAPGSARRAVLMAREQRSPVGHAEVRVPSAPEARPQVPRVASPPDRRDGAGDVARQPLRPPPPHIAAQLDAWSAQAEALLAKSKHLSGPRKYRTGDAPVTSDADLVPRSVDAGRGASPGRYHAAEPTGRSRDYIPAQHRRVVTPADLTPSRSGFASPVRVPAVLVEPPSSPRPEHQRALVTAANNSRASSLTTLHPRQRARQVAWLDSYIRQASPQRRGPPPPLEQLY